MIRKHGLFFSFLSRLSLKLERNLFYSGTTQFPSASRLSNIYLFSLYPLPSSRSGRWTKFSSFFTLNTSRKKKASACIIITVRADFFISFKFLMFKVGNKSFSFFLCYIFLLFWLYFYFSGYSCGRQYKFNVSLRLVQEAKSSQNQANE